MKKQIKAGAVIAFGCALSAAAQVSSAGLYIAIDDAPALPDTGIQQQGNLNTSEYSARPVKRIKPALKSNFGNDIPLELALDKVIQDPHEWTMNIDDNLKGSVVSWKGGQKWEEVLARIGSDNGFSVAINKKDRVLGVSSDNKIAGHLAHETIQIWVAPKRTYLSDVIKEWADREEWDVYWDKSIENDDYVLPSSATFYGPLLGKSGAIDQLLFAFKEAEQPLQAVEFHGNSVIRILPAGSKDNYL